KSCSAPSISKGQGTSFCPGMPETITDGFLGNVRDVKGLLGAQSVCRRRVDLHNELCRLRVEGILHESFERGLQRGALHGIRGQSGDEAADILHDSIKLCHSL